MSDYVNPCLDHNTPYVALNILSKRDRGVYRRIGDMLPEILQGENVITALDEDGNPLLSSVFTPAMTVTGVHVDQTSQGQIKGSILRNC